MAHDSWANSNAAWKADRVLRRIELVLPISPLFVSPRKTRSLPILIIMIIMHTLILPALKFNTKCYLKRKGEPNLKTSIGICYKQRYELSGSLLEALSKSVYNVQFNSSIAFGRWTVDTVIKSLYYQFCIAESVLQSEWYRTAKLSSLTEIQAPVRDPVTGSANFC